MLIRIGNAVVNRDEVLYAWIDNQSTIKVQFKDQSVLRIDSQDPEADLKKLRQGIDA